MGRLVGFVGSRSLGSRFAPLVAGVLSGHLGAGARVAVGCCRGLDALVLRGLARSGLASSLSVFAAFGRSGRGSAPASAVSAVRLASAAGARVVWWAGGGPAVPLRARLAARSRALVRAVAAGGPGSGLVVFLASRSSPGSLAAARFAARSGVPVIAFCCGFPGPPPLLVPGGRWLPFPGPWPAACGWSWSPDLPVQLPLPLTPEQDREMHKDRPTGYQEHLTEWKRR